MAGEPVSRILYGSALRNGVATIIPLVPASRPGSSDLPEGPSYRAACGAAGSSLFRARSASRASSPLLFGLAPRGVCLASAIADGAVGSYPTFSPLPSSRSIRRHLEGFPPSYHRDALRRRYFLCGTFREQQHRLQTVLPANPQTQVCATAPLALPGALPFFAPAAPGLCPALRSRSGVRTFLPLSRSGGSRRRPPQEPAIIRLTRHPDYNPFSGGQNDASMPASQSGIRNSRRYRGRGHRKKRNEPLETRKPDCKPKHIVYTAAL